MAYTRDIPAAGDILSTSQGQILANFNTIDTNFAINHFAYIDVTSNAGKHKYCTLVEQAAPTTVANEVSLYSKATGSISTLYLRHESAGTEVQLSLPAANVVASAAGSSYLPGGVIIKWGTGTAKTALTFGVAFPTACWSVQVTTKAAETQSSWLYVTTTSKTGFNTVDQHTWGFSYIAIGNQR